MPDQTKPDTRILTVDEVEDIAGRKPTYGFGLIVGLTPAERDALCQTLRAAWAEGEQWEEVAGRHCADAVRLATQLAQVERETWNKALAAVPQVGVTFPEGYEEWIDAPTYREHVIDALEAAASEGNGE